MLMNGVSSRWTERSSAGSRSSTTVGQRCARDESTRFCRVPNLVKKLYPDLTGSGATSWNDRSEVIGLFHGPGR